MSFLDKLYKKFNGAIITDKEDTRFCEESKRMITPCGRIFKNENVSSVIIRGAQHMRKDNFTLTSGDVRLGMGLCRTPEKTDKYIDESLKRPLP
jgi:hypothetical protein